MTLECVAKKKTKRVRLFNLDTCGRIIIDDEVPSVLDWDGFETVGFTNKVDAGEEETITNTDGEICFTDISCPLDKGVEVAFTECKENVVFLALAGFGSLVLGGSRVVTDGATTNTDATVTSVTGDFTAADIGKLIVGAGIPALATILSINSGTSIEISANATATASGVTLTIGTDIDVVGFDRESVNCDAAVALEILFATPTLCDAEGNEQCVSRLYPYISLFNDSNQRLVNGKNVMRGTYTATAKKNGRVFENFASDIPTGELSYLATWATGIGAGNAFYYDRMVDCPTLEDARSCELRVFNTGA